MPMMLVNEEYKPIYLDPDDSVLYVPDPGDIFICKNKKYRVLGHLIDIDIDMLYIKCKELPWEA